MDGAHGRLSDYGYCAHDHTRGKCRTATGRAAPAWGRSGAAARLHQWDNHVINGQSKAQLRW